MFVNNLQPEFKLISEKTVHKNCNNIVENLKIKACILIQKVSKYLSYMTNI